jgi:hypothetical protein
MVSRLVLLLLHHLLVLVDWHLPIVLHENLVHVSHLLLLLDHEKLLLLLLVQNVDSTVFAASCWDASGEVCKLV